MDASRTLVEIGDLLDSARTALRYREHAPWSGDLDNDLVGLILDLEDGTLAPSLFHLMLPERVQSLTHHARVAMGEGWMARQRLMPSCKALACVVSKCQMAATQSKDEQFVPSGLQGLTEAAGAFTRSVSVLEGRVAAMGRALSSPRTAPVARRQLTGLIRELEAASETLESLVTAS